MLHKGCRCLDFAVDNIRLAILSLYLILLIVTAVSVVWIIRRQRSSIMEIEWHAPIPSLEHNCLEPTINDYDKNAFRQPVDDLGKGILDKQSEEVDADESPNNINFSQQLASLECTADGKLTAPQNKFELSAFTEQTKPFGNDFTAPSFSDSSGRIDVNFSAIQQVGKDDIDEIGKDLERVLNMGYHGPFSNGQNMSEHIEEELNMTHTVVKNDEDMSITDVVLIPLQDVSKSAPTDMKVSLNKDFVPDKKNIESNSFAPAPCESGEEPKQVVVLDVKRPTLLPEKLEEDKDYRQKLLPYSTAENTPSFVLYVNDDLPKSIDGMLNSKRKNSGFTGSKTRRKKNRRDENEIPNTVPVHKVVITPKYEKASKIETIVFNDSACNMCVTQALPVNMMLPDKQTQQKCQTIKYENDSGNFSDTQKFPINVILPNNNTSPGKQRYSNNIVVIDSKTSRKRTIAHGVKQQLKASYGEEKPIVHLSTSTKPRSKTKTTIDNDESHIFMTESISAKLLAKSKNEKKKIVYDDDPAASISMTLAISANNYLLNELESAVDIKKPEEIKEVKETVIDDDIIEEAINKIKTIACDQVDRDESHISITGAISTNIIGDSTNERKTIAYDEVDSKSLVISTNVYLLDKLNSAADITKPKPNLVFEKDKLKPTEDALQDNRKSTVFVANKFDSKPSLTMGIATVPSLLQTEKKRTVRYNHKCNMSMQHPTPPESISDETKSLYTTKTKLSNQTKQNLAANPPSDVIVLQAITTNREQLTASISEQINLMDPLYRVPTYIKVQKANNWKVATPNTQKVLSLPVIPVSAVMAVHSRGIEKLQLKLITSTTDRTIETVYEGDDDSVTKESLSNISYQSLQRGTYDKSSMAILGSDPSSAVIPQDAADSTSTESMFYIMKDSEFVTQTDRKTGNKAKKTNPKDEEEQVVYLQRQLSELKTAVQNSALPSRSFEIDKQNEHVNIKQQSDNSSRLSESSKSWVDLLDLISNFTGSVVCEDNVQPVTIKVEDQGETIEHKRVSVALNAQSKTLDREDFLRNIFSQASLTFEEKFSSQKKTAVASLSCEEKFSSQKKTAVASLSCEEKFSPLKKTAFASLTGEEKFSPLKKTAFASLTGEEKFSPLKKTAFASLSCEEKFSSLKKTAVASLSCEEKFSPLKKTAFASLTGEEKFSPLKKTAFASLTGEEKFSPLKKTAFASLTGEEKFSPLKKTAFASLTGEEKFSPLKKTAVASLSCEEKFSSLKKTAVASLSCEEKFSPLKKTAFASLTGEEKFSPLKKTAFASLTGEEKFSPLKKTAVASLSCEEKFSSLKKTAVASLSCEEKFSPLKKTAFASLTGEEKFSPLKKTAFASLTGEEKFSPLKKTAFGETSYMFETKEKVTPTYFKDVSDEIKELMLDLVKPMSNDNIQIRLIDGDKTQNTSTHSAKIQVDLATSSHNPTVLVFDHLNPLNNVLLVPNYSKDRHNPSHTEETHCGSGVLLKKISKGNNCEAETFTTTQVTMPEPSTMQQDIYVYQKDDRFTKKDDKFSLQSTSSGSISVDQSTDAISGKLLKKISKGNNYDAETFTSAQFTMMPEPSTMQHDICVYQKDDRFSKKDDQFGSQSTTSGSISLDQSADAISRHLRNEKVNSIMLMRKNEELLGISLSLELVENASQDANRALTSDSNKHKNLKVKFSISPHVNVQGEATKIVKAVTLSGISIRQRFNRSNSRVSVTNSKTQIDCSLSADKHEQYSPSEEKTPKPITKIPKNSKPHKVSAVLSSPDDPTKSLRTEEMFFMFVDQSFRPADPVFDHLTPVDDILNSPTDLTDAHKNDPRKTDQTLFGSASSFNKMSKGDYEMEEALTTTQNTMVLGQNTDNTLTELYNTVHALVNGETESENRVLTPDNEHSNHRINSSRSVLVDSKGQRAGRHQYYRIKSRVNCMSNGKNQICIPSTEKHKKYSPSVKVTRKPIKKIQKISTHRKPRIEPSTELYSPDDFIHSMAAEKDVTETNNRDAHSSTICEKKSPETKETSDFSVHKPCTSAVLDFDLLNPLNNILLAPPFYREVHKYNPRHTDETFCGSGSPVNTTSKGNDNDVKTVTTTLYIRTPEPKKKKKKRNIYLRK